MIAPISIKLAKYLCVTLTISLGPFRSADSWVYLVVPVLARGVVLGSYLSQVVFIHMIFFFDSMILDIII